MLTIARRAVVLAAVLAVAIAAIVALDFPQPAQAQDDGASSVDGRIVVRPWVDDDGQLTRVEFGFRPGWGEDVRGGGDGPDDLFPPKRFLTQRLIDSSAGRWLRSSEILIPDADGSEDGVRGRIIARAEVDDDGRLTRIGFGFRPVWGEDVRGEQSGADDIFPSNRFLTRRLIDNSAGKWLRSSLITVPAERPEEPEPTEGEVGAGGGVASTDDGATIIVPPGAAEIGAEVTARTLDPAEHIDDLPEGTKDAAGGWDFEVEGELSAPVTIRLPLPDEHEERPWFLAHYTDGEWYAEPFEIVDGVVVSQFESLSEGWLIYGVPFWGQVVGACDLLGGKCRQKIERVIDDGLDKLWDGITFAVNWAAEAVGFKDRVVCNNPDESIGVRNPSGGDWVDRIVGVYLKGCAQDTPNGPLLTLRNPRHIWFDVRPIRGPAEYAQGNELYNWLSGHAEGTLLGPGATADWRPTRDGVVTMNADFTWTAAGVTVLYPVFVKLLATMVPEAVVGEVVTRVVRQIIENARELQEALNQFRRGNGEAAFKTLAEVIVGKEMREALVNGLVEAGKQLNLAGVLTNKAIKAAFAKVDIALKIAGFVRSGAEALKVLVRNDEDRFGTVAFTVPPSVCWGGDIAEGTVEGRWNHACQSQRLDGSYARYYRFELDEAQEVTLGLSSEQSSAVYVSRETSRTAKPVRVLTEASDWARAEMEAGLYTIEVATRSAGRTGTFELRMELADMEEDEPDEGDDEPLLPIGDGSLFVLGGTSDLYQAHVVGGALFKRLILNPTVFNGYGFQLSDVRSVEQAEFDRWMTTDLARLGDDAPVWQLFSDDSVRRLLQITPEQFEAAGFDWDAVISINQTEFDEWREGPPITAAELGLESAQDDEADESTGRFIAVSAGLFHSCGLRELGEIECWGSTAVSRPPPAGKFVAVDTGWSSFSTCGLREDGSVQCWGGCTPRVADDGRELGCWWDRNANGHSGILDGRFVAVSVGGRHTCGLRVSGAVECWGNNDDGQTDAPSGSFSAVSAGLSTTCGLRDTGTVVCWGSLASNEYPPPASDFTAVSVGLNHTCGLRETGEIECWGYNRMAQMDLLDAPGGMFIAVSAGLFHSCGLRVSGAVECWGDNRAGQTDAPSGSFSAISAGYLLTCGLRETGQIVCWGNNDDGQADVPGAATTATVNVNEPPQCDDIADAGPLSPGEASRRIRLSDYCRDPENESLWFAVTSSDESIATAFISGSSLIVAGARTSGAATITLTATDPDGLTARTSFRVTVREQTPEPPAIRIACPEYAEAGRSFSCSAHNQGGAATSWDWSASGGAVGGRDETYSVWISSFGPHIVRLTASNPGGSDSDSTTVHLVATPPASQYSRCGSDTIKVYWFDRDNFGKHHVNLTGEEATRILGASWWGTIGHLSQPACDSWPTGAPVTAANYH